MSVAQSVQAQSVQGQQSSAGAVGDAGWWRTGEVRGRVGYVYPAVMAEVILRGTWEQMPPGIDLVLATASIEDLRDEDIAATGRRWIELAEGLARYQLDGVVLGGAPVSNLLGAAREGELLADAEGRLGMPVTTIQKAAVDQLRDLGATRLGVVTPYQPDRTQLMHNYLEAQGLEIGASVSLGRPVKWMHTMRPAEIYRALRQVIRRSPGIDAVYLPVIQIPLPAPEDLREVAQAPVVTAMGSLVWWATGVVGLRRNG